MKKGMSLTIYVIMGLVLLLLLLMFAIEYVIPLKP